MKLKNSYINGLILALILLISPSCSTKKKSWVNRQYHNTTAKYNGYFNGNESIKDGLKKLHANHIDDYTTTISVFPTGDLKTAQKTNSYMDKAIQKGSIVIQRHSMKIKGTEYCKWIDDNYLMVGKAYFYKGDFEEAIKTFSFIINEYSKNEIRFEAALWLVRGYVEKGDFTSAESVLLDLLKDKKFPNKLDKELAVVAADFYVQKKDFTTATTELLNATELIKRKRKKVRLNYILAQIYQYSNNYSLAQKHYELVLKSNPEYEMAFNAKMSLARSLESGNPDTKKMKEKLFKMTKDDKNKEYLDQIYYTIAEMEINNGDTLSAIENYTLSAVNSVENNSQKALSFLALGKIYFEKGSYKLASANYDSTIFYMDNDFRLYEEASARHLILTDLVSNINIVEMQDSLQMLAKLPKSEQSAIIGNIIQAEFEKEKQAAEDKNLKQQMMYESGRNGGREEQFGSNTSGGQWYFYNPATLSFGMSEFRKKWGTRKLEDDWRRKDKKISTNFEIDSTATDSTSVEAQNTKDPNYYLNQLPKTKEDFENSDSQIKEALYQLGVIYKEALNKIDLSTDNFGAIFTRFPTDEQYAALALYNVYINYLETNNPKATNSKETLLSKYPNSIYAKMIVDPNYTSEILSKKDLAELNYQEIFLLYKENVFDQVLVKTENISDEKYKNKLLLLRALSFIQKEEMDKATTILKNISEEDEKVSQEAKYILEAINDPSKMKKANELALAGSPYLYRSNNQHMIILVLPKEGVDVTYLKTLISDFHTNSLGNEVFEISALLLGLDQHLLMIKSFENIKKSMSYYELFIQEGSVMEVLNKSEYKIMSISFENFQEFYKNKDAQGYYNFFTKNYLTND
ncbi:MAG: tetratricopeptide repeat protein [Pelagibacterales bacterium]|nr:tetratricopeptide repeat protein [Pelagibacterales bacterium]